MPDFGDAGDVVPGDFMMKGQQNHADKNAEIEALQENVFETLEFGESMVHCRLPFVEAQVFGHEV